MMKLFDFHADIGFDVINKRKKGLHDILNTYHIQKFRAGNISYISMASYFEGSESWADMQDMVIALKEEITMCEDVDLVLSINDLKNENGHVKAILSIEGMCGIREDVSTKIQWLYEQGVRIASFCWNDENALATGVRGDAHRGLTKLGIEALHTMETLHMIVDVSHANEKTFWDIMDNSSALVIASHSNVRTLCDHPRNLRDNQIDAIKQRGGIIGVVSAPIFVDKDKEKQDIAHLIDHIAYLKQRIGIERVALGFDFMDFYDDCEDFYTKGLRDSSQASNLITALQAAGFSFEEIEGIAYKNGVDILAGIL